MKNLILIALLFLTTSCFAQSFPNLAPQEIGGQLLNLSNTLPKAILDTVTTSSSASTLFLTTGRYSSTTGLPLLNPIIGYGTISFTVSGLKISGTPTGNVALQGSLNGTEWTPVRSGAIISSDTLQIGNVTTAQTYSWAIDSKRFRYYRLAITIPSSTQSTSWAAYWYLNKQFFYTK